MTLAGRLCCAAIWQIAPAVPALADAAGPDTAPFLPGVWLPFVFLGIGGCLAVFVAGFCCAGISQRRRDRLHRDRLGPIDQPAAISTTDGTLVWANRSALEGHEAMPATLQELLAPYTRVDAGQVYRTGSAAIRLGFGAERVSCCDGDSMCVLVAGFDPPGKLIWTLVPARELAISAPVAGPERYDDAPFGYLSVDAAGESTGNSCFRNQFAAEPVLTELRQADAGQVVWQQVILTARDGTGHLCQVRADPREAGNPQRSGYFVFPILDANASSGAAAAFEAMPVALVQLDPRGRVLRCNGLAREMVGDGLVPGADLAALAVSLGRPISSLLAEAGADGGGQREMLRLRGEDEEFLYISVTPVTLDGSRTLLGVLSDASELRHLEDKFAQSQKMEAVGKLAGGVAHDFNNVLTAISGHSDLLLLGKDALHPDYSDLIQIRQNTHRAAALVRQLLAFSRKQTLNPVLLSVQDVVSDVLYLLDRLIGERVTLVLEHGQALGPVRADHQQIEQALMNLVVNARDAMQAGGVVTIATCNRRFEMNSVREQFEIPAGDYVEIAVSDEGTGIDPQIIDRIFNPFFTTKPQGEGTGLGLSTVYGIVKQSGGFVFAENRPSGGACFRILLPHADAGAAPALPANPVPQAIRGDLTGHGAVLLVEDEDAVRSFASRALRLRGYEVLEADSAEEALKLIEDPEVRIDLLVSDVVMPGHDGPTLSNLARAKRPGLRVVFVSGYAEDSFRRNLIDHDFLFLPKPFSLVDLTAKVKEAMSRPAAAPRG